MEMGWVGGGLAGRETHMTFPRLVTFLLVEDLDVRLIAKGLLLYIPWIQVHFTLLLTLVSYRVVQPMFYTVVKSAGSLEELQEEVEEIERITGCQVSDC